MLVGDLRPRRPRPHAQRRAQLALLLRRTGTRSSRTTRTSTLMGSPSLLQHIWSLAVEEQFYIVWPLLLVPCLVLFGRKRLPMLVIAGIAGLGRADVAPLQPGRRSLARLLRHGHARLPAPDGDPARARLAVRRADPARAAAPRAARRRGARRRRSASSGTMQDFDPTLYHGGDLAAAFCFAVLIAAVAHPRDAASARRSASRRCAGSASGATGSISGTGRSSCSLAGVNARTERRRRGRAGSCSSLAAAALSYRFVEQPIRTGTPAAPARPAPAAVPAGGHRRRSAGRSPWPSRSCS